MSGIGACPGFERAEGAPWAGHQAVTVVGELDEAFSYAGLGEGPSVTEGGDSHGSRTTPSCRGLFWSLLDI